jgi:hypothetical protein
MNQQFIRLEDHTGMGHCVKAEALVSSVRIAVDGYGLPCNGVASYLSYDDARRLVEMLVKHTHPGHSIEPNKPVKAPQLILAWQHPANGNRFSHVSSELVATQGAVELRRGQPDFPIWLAQITKQFVQPNPTYEWKDL